MNQLQEDIKSFLKNYELDALNFLEQLVGIESYSQDKEGVNQVSYLIKDKLESNGINCNIIENRDYGNHLTAKINGNGQGKILLIGHQDTAHPTGTLAEFPYQNDGSRLTGPGVSDMKSGLVYMIYTLLAFNHLKAKDMYNNMYDIELLFTPDEEIGSPISRNLIENMATDAKVAFVLEPGRPDGSIVTARKGSAHLKIEVEGKAAHSGAFIEDGISANDELASKMIAIKRLSDKEKDFTINFGIINGGISNNIVSPYAMTTIHCAFWKEEDFQEAYKQIQDIVDNSFIEGTQSTLSGGVGMVPMENNEKNNELYENIVLRAANDLDINILGLPTKGASEAGFTSSVGVPTICGMGPVGGKWHTKDEYLILESFLPRMKLLATSVLYCMRYY